MTPRAEEGRRGRVRTEYRKKAALAGANSRPSRAGLTWEPDEQGQEETEPERRMTATLDQDGQGRQQEATDDEQDETDQVARRLAGTTAVSHDVFEEGSSGSSSRISDGPAISGTEGKEFLCHAEAIRV
jgi:hypothetical protein